MPSWLESGCDSSSSGGQSFPGAFLVGMAASVCSSIGSSFGCVLQKKAHAQNEQRVADGQPSYTVFAGIMLSPLWISGFVLLVLLPLPFDFISLALAPASLITPLGGVTIILNQIAAPICLGEKVSRLDWIATGVIVVGIVIASAFGVHCSNTYTGGQLAELYNQTAFIVVEVLLLTTMAVLLWCVHISGPEAITRSCCKDEPDVQLPPWRLQLKQNRYLCYAFLAGGFGANTNVLLKSCGEMAENVFAGGSDEDYAGYIPHLTMVGTVICAVGQIMHLNMGGALAPAVKYFPIYNVALITLTTVVALIYFEEYRLLSYAGIVAYPVGLIIVLFGIYILTWQQPAQVADEDIQEDAAHDDAKAASTPDERSKSSPGVQLRGRPRLALPASPYTAALPSESTPTSPSLLCSPITIAVAEEKEKNSKQVTDVQAAGVHDLETPPCRPNKLPPLD